MSKIQLGFLYPLNYPFVVANTLSSVQIFTYLPVGIANGLGIKLEQVQLQSLVPYNTSAELGYLTTLAYAYIPTTLVNTLSLDLHIPTSGLYKNPDPLVEVLMGYINPAIPLTPGTPLESTTTNTGSGSSASGSSPAGNGEIFNTNDQNTSPGVSGTTAGIALAAIGASAAYGAAMFLIARRYKRRKQGHRRSSSVLDPSEMRQSGSPALLGGANAFMSGGRVSPGGTTYDRNSRGSGRSAGNSARAQQISAPMMAENSLGWNWIIYTPQVLHLWYPRTSDLGSIPVNYHKRQQCSDPEHILLKQFFLSLNFIWRWGRH
jgi:hypothetical protein